MPKLHENGDLTLSKVEVETLRSLIYAYGRACKDTRSLAGKSAQHMQRVRSILVCDRREGSDDEVARQG